jgi:flagellum-specific peptidoglycan hydrolase FlgJ
MAKVEELITPQVLSTMMTALVDKGISLDKLVAAVEGAKKTMSPSKGTTTLDLSTSEGVQKYAEICQSFIETRNPNAQVTGQMMANAAASVYNMGYVPPELALAQLTIEGGLSTNKNAKPIRTNNPFNVGNVDSGAVKHFQTKQDGINAYYNLMVKTYLTKGKDASELLRNFVNVSGKRYASDPNYEKLLANVVAQANRVAGKATGAP